MRASLRGRHISGAEGLFEAPEVQKAAKRYIKRALTHPKGRPDEITITVEVLKTPPLKTASLPVWTIRSGSTKKARGIVKSVLSANGISEKAQNAALSLLRAGGTVRGAALIEKTTGKRLDKEPLRGLRVSRLGIQKGALGSLSARLSKRGINTDTVKEAIVLASKVASAPGISAELCISDDPHYTTGYVASTEAGYLRVPCMKRKGSKSGGRVFFTEPGADVEKIALYLEKRPVMVGSVSPVGGIISLDELSHISHSKPRGGGGDSRKNK